jgi:hypothetical protein
MTINRGDGRPLRQCFQFDKNYVERAAAHMADGEFPSYFEEIAMQQNPGFRAAVERRASEFNGSVNLSSLGENFAHSILPAELWSNSTKTMYFRSCCYFENSVVVVDIYRYELSVGAAHVMLYHGERDHWLLDDYYELLRKFGWMEIDRI